MSAAASYDATLPRERRRAAGAYYTPLPLIDLLLDHGLEPLLDRTPDLLSLRIADPACGDGRFLMAAAQRIARRGPPISDVIRQCLSGVDMDSGALAICRRKLARAAGAAARSLTRIRQADGLMAWRPGEFDAVVGNPPFRNAIEGPRQNRNGHPLVGGTADLAYRFLVRASELVRPGGIVAFVQPRPVLNAGCMERFRRSLIGDLRPNLIFAPDRSKLFTGALVFACGIVLGPGATCRVSREPAPLNWAEGTIDSSNWWRAINSILDRTDSPTPGSRTLGDEFEIHAGMTAGEAYDLRPYVRESPRAARGRLVTTGLIDPNECHWGRRRCRYLGRDFQRPAVALSSKVPAAIRKRLIRSRRPKILVAGLSRRLECVLDTEGRLLGAVATFAILHPADDVAALARLVDWLHGPEVDRRFRHDLGANAVGGGDTVMTKAFLKALPHWASEPLVRGRP